jgi:internalin A
VSSRQDRPHTPKPAFIRRENLLAHNAVVRSPVLPQLRCYVSYAWGDNTAEGRSRDEAVERLCMKAEEQGVVVIRDKTVLRAGDLISEFMKELGSGDRIIALLSDKYLRSPHCMTELLEVWRNSRHDRAEFRRRLRAFALPCARIRNLSERVAYGAFWKTEHATVETYVKQHGSSMLGINGAMQHQMIAQIASDTTDLLTQIADTVTPLDFDEFLQFGFEGLNEPDCIAG